MTYSRGVVLDLNQEINNRTSRQKEINWLKENLAGLEHVEISSESTDWSAKDSAWFKKQLRDWRIIVHAPYINLSLVSEKLEIREVSLELLCRSIYFAVQLGAEVVTFHAGSRPSWILPIKIEQFFTEYSRRLSRYVNGRLDLALENMIARRASYLWPYPDSLEELGKIIAAAAVNEENIRFCTLDIGHCIRNSEDWEKFLLANSTRVRNIHLHNARSTGSDHYGLQLPGDLDFAALKDVLPKVDYDGFLTLEMFDHGDLEASWKILINELQK